MRTPTALALLATTLLTGTAFSQVDAKPQQAAPPETKPAATKPDDLSGPKVEKPKATYTLVKTGFNGKLERITQPIEEATLAILPLSPEEREKVDRILVARAATVDKGIKGSVPIILRIQGVREEGITTDRQAAIRELNEKLPILRDRDGFRAELRLVLTAENAARFDAVMSEYVRAATLQASADAKAEGRKGNPFLMSLGESLRLVGLEVQQSFDRIVKDGTDKTDRLIEVIQPTAEQEGAIRNLITDFGQKTQLNPSPAQRSAFVKDLMKLLTVKQREVLVTEWYSAATPDKPEETKPATPPGK